MLIPKIDYKPSISTAAIDSQEMFLKVDTDA